jgi:hypothetical protein
MLLIWLYIFLLWFIWMFFIIKKLNIVEFENLSLNVKKITNFTFIFLLILTLLWLGFVVKENFSKTKIKVDKNNILENVYY